MASRVIDLFCGAGGMSQGFRDARFQGVWAIDNDANAVATYVANHGDHATHADIEKWLADGSNVPSADVVVGGPPCQGFSSLNKNKRAGDARRALWQPYMDVVERSGARVFVVENVPQLASSDEGKALMERAQASGFKVVTAIVNAADYGAPQARKRALIVGWKRGESSEPTFPPARTHAAPGDKPILPRWATVRDAFVGLGEPEGAEIRDVAAPMNLHFGRSPTPKSIARYKAVPPGGNRFDLQANAPELTPACWTRKKTGSRDVFGRLLWDRPSVTIRTEFFKPEKGRYLHPESHRSITHREAARLMSFPDDYRFVGSKASVARQIGNAVPPKLAEAIAGMVAEMLETRLPDEARGTPERELCAAGE
jgi:DNA (cytosine-5)-methyltransferase 1